MCLPAMILLGTACASAQETKPDVPSSTPYTLTVNSQLVILDVVVTDKKGQVRNDLHREDFQVTEDGIPQNLTGFQTPAEHPVPAANTIRSTADLQRLAPQASANVIVLDEVNTRFEDMAYARYSLKKYLNAQADSVQTPTMLIAVSHERLQVLHDYTQDREAILSSLDHHLTAFPWHLQTGISRIEQLALSLGALEQVAQATVGHPGHKNLIWVGHGFPGLDLTSPSLDSNSVKGINTAVQQAVNMLRDSRTTLYTIDPTPLSSSVVVRTGDDTNAFGALEDATGADPFESDVQFVKLAAATGGKSFYSRNDVDREIEESVRDGANYYTLSYRPSNGSSEERPYRKIRITLTDADLRAGYRDGYYTRDDGEPKSLASRAVYDTDSAEESTMVYTGLTVQAAKKSETDDVYLVGVPQSQLTWTAASAHEESKLTVVALELNNKGRILKRVTQDITAQRAASPDGAPHTGLARVEVALPSLPGAARLRFVVRSTSNGHIGTADLAVPGAPPPPKPSR